MGQKTCPTCHGRRGYSASESVPNTAPGGALWTTVQVWKDCGHCFGSGFVWAPDPPLTTPVSEGHRTESTRTPQPVEVDNRTPEEQQRDAEDGIASLFMLATWGAIGWYGVTTWPVPWYWPVGVAFVAGFAVYRILTRPLRIIPKAILWLFSLLVKLLAVAALVALIAGLIYLIQGQETGPQPVAAPLQPPEPVEPRADVPPPPVRTGFGASPRNESEQVKRPAERRRSRVQPGSEK